MFLTVPVNRHIEVIKVVLVLKKRYVCHCVFVTFKSCFTEKSVKLLSGFYQTFAPFNSMNGNKTGTEF